MSETHAHPEEPYVVTRGKPPREYQFKKGQSGNPKGRPKESKQIGALIDEELDRKMEVTLRGRRTKLAKRQIMVRQLVDRALQGDHKAIATCLAIQGAHHGGTGKEASQPTIAEEFDAELSKDELIFIEFMARQAHPHVETQGADKPAPQHPAPAAQAEEGGEDD